MLQHSIEHFRFRCERICCYGYVWPRVVLLCNHRIVCHVLLMITAVFVITQRQEHRTNMLAVSVIVVGAGAGCEHDIVATKSNIDIVEFRTVHFGVE